MATESTTNHRVLTMLTAITGGVLLVLALQAVLSARGLQIVDVWRDVMAGNPLTLRVASVWWVIAGSALVTGAVIARPLAMFPPPWRRYRVLRWIVGAVIVFALAHIGHGAEVPHGVSAVVYMMATTLAIIIGAVMAAIGAIFALRG